MNCKGRRGKRGPPGKGSACSHRAASAWTPSAKIPSRPPTYGGGKAILTERAAILEFDSNICSLRVVSSVLAVGSQSGEQACSTAQQTAAPARGPIAQAAPPPDTLDPAWVPASPAKARR